MKFYKNGHITGVAPADIKLNSRRDPCQTSAGIRRCFTGIVVTDTNAANFVFSKTLLTAL